MGALLVFWCSNRVHSGVYLGVLLGGMPPSTGHLRYGATQMHMKVARHQVYHSGQIAGQA